jgi:nucleoside 2-deoxyribosyltransferase
MIYLACSFACSDKDESKRRQNEMSRAEVILESYGLDVYVPSRLKIPNAWDYSERDWGLMVFANDLHSLDISDIVVFLSYGKKNNNDGSAWECGYAFAKGKKVIVVSMSTDTESLMVMHGSYAQLDGLDGLEQYDFKKMPRTQLERRES